MHSQHTIVWVICMKIFLAFILLILSVIGLSEILHSFKLFLLKPKRCDAFVVCPLNDEYSVLKLKYVIEKLRWNKINYAEQIVAVLDTEYDGELISCCSLADKHNVRIIEPNEFEVFLNNWSSKWSK